MFTVNVSCLVDRPLNEVFNCVADFRNAASWQPNWTRYASMGARFPKVSRLSRFTTSLASKSRR